MPTCPVVAAITIATGLGDGCEVTVALTVGCAIAVGLGRSVGVGGWVASAVGDGEGGKGVFVVVGEGEAVVV